MPNDPPLKPTAALREWFRYHESASSGEAPAPDDDLRDLLFFWFFLECDDCGLIDWFDRERSAVDDDHPNWPWEFANLAVVPARSAGWTTGPDKRGFPQAFCPSCSKKREQS